MFDLDGTVLDTAPDMSGALNALRVEHRLPPLPPAALRPLVSHGSGRLVKAGFPDAGAELTVQLQQRFLTIYRDALSAGTELFPGMDEVLTQLAVRGLKCGIITNKPAHLTDALLEALGLRERFCCVVSGDTLAQRKPHPMPLLHAAALAEALPEECIYVGDAERDVQAAHAAGMPALVADYGYQHEDEDTHGWGAEGHLAQPTDLLSWLDASGRA